MQVRTISVNAPICVGPCLQARPVRWRSWLLKWAILLLWPRKSDLVTYATETASDAHTIHRELSLQPHGARRE